MKNSGLFLTWQKVFLFVFLQVLMLLWLVLVCVFGKVAIVLKMRVFPSLGGFCGVAYSWLFGFGRFRCFCGFCFCFSFV